MADATGQAAPAMAELKSFASNKSWLRRQSNLSLALFTLSVASCLCLRGSTLQFGPTPPFLNS